MKIFKIFLPLLLSFNQLFALNGKITYETNTKIQLTGKIVIGRFHWGGGDREVGQNEYDEYYELILNTPINVSKERKFGPISNIEKIQIAPNNDDVDQNIDSYINKYAVLDGELFYGNNRHHYTKVLILCDKINLVTDKNIKHNKYMYLFMIGVFVILLISLFYYYFFRRIIFIKRT
jgi:hypothetical protein